MDSKTYLEFVSVCHFLAQEPSAQLDSSQHFGEPFSRAASAIRVVPIAALFPKRLVIQRPAARRIHGLFSVVGIEDVFATQPALLTAPDVDRRTTEYGRLLYTA